MKVEVETITLSIYQIGMIAVEEFLVESNARGEEPPTITVPKVTTRAMFAQYAAEQFANDHSLVLACPKERAKWEARKASLKRRYDEDYEMSNCCPESHENQDIDSTTQHKHARLDADTVMGIPHQFGYDSLYDSSVQDFNPQAPDQPAPSPAPSTSSTATLVNQSEDPQRASKALDQEQEQDPRFSRVLIHQGPIPPPRNPSLYPSPAWVERHRIMNLPENADKEFIWGPIPEEETAPAEIDHAALEAELAANCDRFEDSVEDQYQMSWEATPSQRAEWEAALAAEVQNKAPYARPGIMSIPPVSTYTHMQEMAEELKRRVECKEGPFGQPRNVPDPPSTCPGTISMPPATSGTLSMYPATSGTLSMPPVTSGNLYAAPTEDVAEANEQRAACAKGPFDQPRNTLYPPTTYPNNIPILEYNCPPFTAQRTEDTAKQNEASQETAPAWSIWPPNHPMRSLARPHTTSMPRYDSPGISFGGFGSVGTQLSNSPGLTLVDLDAAEQEAGTAWEPTKEQRAQLQRVQGPSGQLQPPTARKCPFGCSKCPVSGLGNELVSTPAQVEEAEEEVDETGEVPTEQRPQWDEAPSGQLQPPTAPKCPFGCSKCPVSDLRNELVSTPAQVEAAAEEVVEVAGTSQELTEEQRAQWEEAMARRPTIAPKWPFGSWIPSPNDLWNTPAHIEDHVEDGPQQYSASWEAGPEQRQEWEAAVLLEEAEERANETMKLKEELLGAFESHKEREEKEEKAKKEKEEEAKKAKEEKSERQWQEALARIEVQEARLRREEKERYLKMVDQQEQRERENEAEMAEMARARKMQMEEEAQLRRERDEMEVADAAEEREFEAWLDRKEEAVASVSETEEGKVNGIPTFYEWEGPARSTRMRTVIEDDYEEEEAGEYDEELEEWFEEYSEESWEAGTQWEETNETMPQLVPQESRDEGSWVDANGEEEAEDESEDDNEEMKDEEESKEATGAEEEMQTEVLWDAEKELREGNGESEEDQEPGHDREEDVTFEADGKTEIQRRHEGYMNAERKGKFVWWW
ncbi:hypothetical protein MMC10_005956 [Thelotrema lepadinum]|nr:hypothetical protein [Thelotrema lepadinum]